MRQLSYALGALVLLSGCASQEYTGQGEYFELYNVNVIERDLSVFKPTQIVSTALEPSTVSASSQPHWFEESPIKAVSKPSKPLVTKAFTSSTVKPQVKKLAIGGHA